MPGLHPRLCGSDCLTGGATALELETTLTIKYSEFLYYIMYST